MSDTQRAKIECDNYRGHHEAPTTYVCDRCGGSGWREVTLRLPEPHSIHSQSHLHGVLWELVEVTDE